MPFLKKLFNFRPLFNFLMPIKLNKHTSFGKPFFECQNLTIKIVLSYFDHFIYIHFTNDKKHHNIQKNGRKLAMPILIASFWLSKRNFQTMDFFAWASEGYELALNSYSKQILPNKPLFCFSVFSNFWFPLPRLHQKA